MNKSRPLIAITHSGNSSKIIIFFIKLAVWLAGGKPFCISVERNAANFTYHGLILYGGVDINPVLYGSEPKENYTYENERDLLELKHLKFAEQNDLPVLGICRGCQLINIYRKGTLHLDIVKAYEKAKYPFNLLGFIFFRKRIYIQEDSKIFTMLRTNTVMVNSLHRQAIQKLGQNLSVTACEKNQLIQCIEDSDKDFYLGVQFHPEFLIHRTRFRRIFSLFVKKASERQ